MLEKIHTDQRYYDLLRYGVEGIHYHLVNGFLDYTDIPSANGFGWTPVTDNLLGREVISVSEEWHEQIDIPYTDWYEEIAGQAVTDPLWDFTMDLSNLEQIAEEMEQVRLQYFQPILCGFYEDPQQALQEANEALYQAGFDAYFDSMQRQITDYFERE